MFDKIPSEWMQPGAAALAAFLASLVECVEALTIVLAVGVTRGWRSSLSGAGAGLAVLALMTLIVNLWLPHLPFSLAVLQLAIGVLLLLFGANWLRKAVLRAAGLKALHDEALAYDEQTRQMKQEGETKREWDFIAFLASFKATMVEGIEVIFIVIAVGAAQKSMVPAAFGALIALLLVTALGFVLHRPLTRIPENVLKWAVGIVLCAFGIFWIGEGAGLEWPGGDLAIVVLALVVWGLSAMAVRSLRRK